MCQNDNAKLKEIKDKHWELKSDPRKHRNGGGIGILHRNSFNIKCNEKISKYKSFQVMEGTLLTDNDVIRLVNVYRPGYSKKAKHTQCFFFNEFDNYLSELSEKPGTPLILGDFNFHMEQWMDNNYMKINESKFSMTVLLNGFTRRCCY